MASGDNPCIPYNEPGDRLTGYCTDVVRGKRVVVPSASPPGGFAGTENPRIAEAGASAVNPIGIAAYEGSIADNIPLINANGVVVPCVVGAAITFGQLLVSDAQGRVIPRTAENVGIVGVAMETNAVVDSDIAVRLTL